MDDSAATPERSPGAGGLATALWLTAFAAILFGIKAYAIDTYGSATPFWDQWNAEAQALYKRYIEGGLAWRHMVAPHVVHRIFTSRLSSLGLFAANGTWNPLLQMVVNAALWVGTLGVLVVLLDRATGRRHLPLLLAFALVTFGLPYGHENMLWGFQGAFYFFIFWSTLALHALALAAPFVPRWWAGVACGLLGFLSLGSGSLTAAVAAAVAAAQYASGTRRGSLQLLSAAVLGTLFVIGILLIPADASMDEFGARSAAEALGAWVTTASWPLRIGLPGPLIAFAPAIVLAATIARRPPPAGDARWFLLAAAAGALGQAAAIAYGRAAGSLASRYQDLFAVGLIVNFACALALIPGWSGRSRSRAVASTVAWVVIMLGALAWHTHRHAGPELATRRETARIQQEYVRRYVLTGDIGHLADKPRLEVPYPDPVALAAWLDDSTIRSFLPPAIAPSLPTTGFSSDPVGGFVAGGAGTDAPPRDEPTWGSHGALGPEGVGAATLVFGNPHRGYAVTVPVAVGGGGDGIALEVEQDGERRPVSIPATAAAGHWTPLRIKVHRRPFTLHIADRSPTAWVAVAAPVAEGRFDRCVRRILDRWDRFILAGIVVTMALLVHRSLTKDRN